MKIEAARFTADALEMTIDGRVAFADTKKSLLDAGIVVLLDDDPAEPYWQRTTAATLAADPEDGRPEPLIIPGGTRDAAVLALARRYWSAVNAEDFAEGAVTINEP